VSERALAEGRRLTVNTGGMCGLGVGRGELLGGDQFMCCQDVCKYRIGGRNIYSEYNSTHCAFHW
jgi:hypothetical protein